MPEENKFYRVNNYCDKLEPGKEFCIKRSIEAWARDYDLSPLVVLTEKDLISQQKESIGRETQTYETLQKSTGAWEEQAGQTLLLEKALEYVRTKEVTHTSNEWKHTKDGLWEISNRVYKMWYEFTTDSTNVGTWRVTWNLEYNVPLQPEHGIYTMQYTGDYIKIAGQNRKPYDTIEAAQSYIQSRFDQYDYLFAELSPPVPDDKVRMFRINGQLLPGYTVEPKRETVVSELMDFIEAGDTQPTPKSVEKPTKKPTPQAPSRQKKPSAKGHPAR